MYQFRASMGARYITNLITARLLRAPRFNTGRSTSVKSGNVDTDQKRTQRVHPDESGV